MIDTPSDRRAGVEARAEKESPIALGLALCDTLACFFGPHETREGILATLVIRGCLRSEAQRIVDAFERLTGREGLAGETHGR